MIWSIENLRAQESAPHQEKERAGTATVLFSCNPLPAPEAVWELPKIKIPFREAGDWLRYGEEFKAIQQAAIKSHDAECPGHQGQHHFMVTAGYTYNGRDGSLSF